MTIAGLEAHEQFGGDVAQVGDVVGLRSGSPLMTVEQIDGSDVRVVWFIGDRVERALLPRAALVKK